MPTFAEVSKYLANRKKSYEKLANSPLESERNTAKRMVERIDKKTDELFYNQEVQKIIAPNRGTRQDVMLGDGGKTPPPSSGTPPDFDEKWASIVSNVLTKKGIDEIEASRLLENEWRKYKGIPDNGEVPIDPWRLATSQPYLDYFKNQGLENKAHFSLTQYEKDGGVGYGLRERAKAPRLEDEWVSPIHKGGQTKTGSFVERMLYTLKNPERVKTQSEIDAEIAEEKARNKAAMEKYEQEKASRPLFINEYVQGKEKQEEELVTFNWGGAPYGQKYQKRATPFYHESFLSEPEPFEKVYIPNTYSKRKIEYTPGGMSEPFVGFGLTGSKNNPVGFQIPDNSEKTILEEVLSSGNKKSSIFSEAFKSGGKELLSSLGEMGIPLGSALGEFAMRNKAIADMEAPEKPIYNPAVHLNTTLDTSADENAIARAIRMRQKNAENYAPNAQALMAEYGASTGQSIQAKNQISQQANNYKAQMENAQATANAQVNQYNNMMANQYLRDVNEFNNNKVNAKAATWAQLMNKFGMANQESGMRKHDLKKAEIMFAKLSPEVREAMFKMIRG